MRRRWDILAVILGFGLVCLIALWAIYGPWGKAVKRGVEKQRPYVEFVEGR